MTALQRKTAIHDRFTQVAVSGGGHDGIVRALFELTGLAAGIEDRRGTLQAWAGPEPVGPQPVGPAPDDGAGRELVVERALRAGHPIRSGGRLVTVARPRHDVVGVLFLVDPDGSAGESETMALEHAATVLAVELARLLSVAETELRLGIDVVADLVGGTDVVGASRRAEALGRDLARPHRVVVIGTSQSRPEPDALVHAVRGALTGPQAPLLMQRGDTVVLLDRGAVRRGPLLRPGPADRPARHPGGPLAATSASAACAWARRTSPAPTGEALLALRMPERGRPAHGRGRCTTTSGSTSCSPRSRTSPASTRSSAAGWGALVDYDTRRGSSLVLTLSHFLDAGGRYDTAAATLAIGRSTLRYRLARIAELSGHDLADPDTRFQLHLATKAWFTRQALSGG